MHCSNGEASGTDLNRPYWWCKPVNIVDGVCVWGLQWDLWWQTWWMTPSLMLLFLYLLLAEVITWEKGDMVWTLRVCSLSTSPQMVSDTSNIVCCMKDYRNYSLLISRIPSEVILVLLTRFLFWVVASDPSELAKSSVFKAPRWQYKAASYILKFISYFPQQMSPLGKHFL